MITELETLAILAAVEKARGKLTPEEIRAAAVIGSLFSGSLVRYDGVVESILLLQRKGVLRGDSDHLALTVEGKALLKALGEKRIGRSRLETLDKLVEPLSSSPSTTAFVQTYGHQVTDMLQSLKSKSAAPTGEIVLCALLLRIEGLQSLHRSTFDLPKSYLAEGAKPWPSLQRAREALSEAVDSPVYLTTDDGTVALLSAKPVSSIELDGTVLRARHTSSLDPKVHAAYWTEAVQSYLTHRLVDQGYSPVGSVRRVFVRYRNRSAGDQPGIPAVRLTYQVLEPPHVLVWAEAFTKPWTRAIDLVSGLKSKEEIQERLAGQLFRTLPYERPASVSDVIPNVDLQRERVPGKPLNYLDYWADLGYELEERVQPLLLMKTKTGQYHYPAETVLVRAESPRLLEAHEPLVLTPEDRHDELRELAGLSFPSGSASWQGLTLVLESVAPTLTDLPCARRPRATVIHPPLLRFANGQISGDPLDVFTKGPEAGRKRVVVATVYHPAHVDSRRCIDAINVLCRHYGSRGFGEGRVDPEVQVIAYRPDSPGPDLGALVRKTAKKGGPETIGIAVVEEGSDAYFAFKRYHPEVVGSPLQALQVDTLLELLAKKRAVLDQLALNLYLKRLDRKESAWTLLSPAGGADRTSYLAIGFSRALDPRRAGKGVAVLHDGVGRGLNWDMLVTPGERTITENWFNTVLDQIRPLIEGEPFDRLVFYRTGHLYPTEVEAIRRSLESRGGFMKKQVEFVAILNEHRRFFFRVDGVLRNPSPGTAILWSEDEALLAASGFAERGIWRGTVVPVGLRRVLGASSIDLLVSEYHDLTHLSWSAPTTTWKHPLVMKIAERLAESAREGVPASAIRYLPL